MATVTPTVTQLEAGTQVVLIEWLAMANGDVGAPVTYVDYPDMTVDFGGTFGTGGSVTLKGGNKSGTYNALTDPQGNAITLTAAGIEAVAETPRFVRPEVTAGDGTTAIDVRLLARRASR